MNVGAVKAPAIWRSQACKRSRLSVSISPSRYSRSTASTQKISYHPAAVEAALCPGVLPEASAVPGRHRSLCLIASLVAGAQGARPHGAPDAAGLREALWCAPKARVTSGGRFHPESCRLIWQLTSGLDEQSDGPEPRDKGRFGRPSDPAGRPEK